MVSPIWRSVAESGKSDGGGGYGVSAGMAAKRQGGGTAADRYAAGVGSIGTMTHRSRSWERLLAGAALGTLMLGGPARAADVLLPVKAPYVQPLFEWTGFYVGAYSGYSRGTSSATLVDPVTIMTNKVVSGLIGGVQAGYNYRMSSGLLLGTEADFSFPNYLPTNHVVSAIATARSDLEERWDYVGTVRSRIGYTSGPWLAYVTGGFAWAGERFVNTPAGGTEERDIHVRFGWAAGAGLEYGFAPHWSVKLEYLYSQFGNANILLPSGAQYASSLDFQSLRIGLNRKVDLQELGNPTSKTSLSDTESDRWEIHGQTTYLGQGYPAFRAPYSGPNSLTPAPQYQNTWSNSLYLNARLWEGGEVYYNPELLQGFGLNDTVGLAGFSSGEAQKSNFPYPHYNTSRLFVRQTFGFGGEQEELASGQQQLPGKVDVSRLTLQAGKFAVLDVFDGNSYAKDTRKDFMNWSIWAPGAFDYSADKLGLTYGVTAELNQKQWALRGGYFLMDAESNSNNFDTRVFQRGEYRRRAGDTLLAVLAARQTAYHRLAQQRQFRQLSRNAEQPGAQSRYFADPRRPHQIRLCHQPRAGPDRRHRIVRPLELERWQDRDHGLHRYRCLALDGHLDQGCQMGPARRRDRDRRRDQRPVARSSRFPRGRRPRSADR